MKKKTLAALLAALMALMLVLSACAKSDADYDDDDDADESAPPQTEEAADAKTDDDADSEPAPATQDFYKERRWYDENDVLIRVDHHDSDGYLAMVDVYTTDGDLDYIIDLRHTPACDAVDTSVVAAMDGVETVDVRQLYIADANSPDDFAPYDPWDCFFVCGYNAQGEIAGFQRLEDVEGNFVVMYTTAYDFSADGGKVTATGTAGNGDLYFERTDENTYENGKIRKTVSTTVITGPLVAFVNEYVVITPYDEPVTEIRTAEYVY